MTDKRDRTSTDPGLGPLDAHGLSTLPSLPVVGEASISPHSPVYYEPLPLAAVSDHKTLETETVKLAEDIDPRRLVTERRLGRARALLPASDSGWPAEAALSSSQPPMGPGRRFRTRVVFWSLLAALLALAALLSLTRGNTQLARAAGPSAASARQSRAFGASTATSPLSAAGVGLPESSPASTLRVASAVLPAPLPSTVVPASTATVVEHAGARVAPAAKHVAKQSLQLAAQGRSPSVPSSSKPKRAIY